MSPPTPHISVVIPTFNRSRQLLIALESALAQTWQNREIIVVDDGSTDDTAERLVPYLDRIRYFCQENQGVAAAQNRGWEMSKGPWISVLADDDAWEPQKLEKQMEALRHFHYRPGACFTDCRFSGDPAQMRTAFEQARHQPSQPYSLVTKPVDLVLRRHPAIFVQSLIVRRSLLQDLEGFDESLVIGEDTDLLFRLALRTEFCCVNEALVSIDRRPTRTDGLADILKERSDRSFAAQSSRLDKWLGSNDQVAPDIRSKIVDDLKEVHYCWAISRLYKLRPFSAFVNLREIWRLGSSPVEIVHTLWLRARRRLRAALASPRVRHWTEWLQKT